MQDTIKKCYEKRNDYYNLNYHEYVFYIDNSKNYSSTEYVIFNSVNFTFTPVDDLINNKILTNKNCGGRAICLKEKIDIGIVNDILNSLITNDVKVQYKKLVYNLIVKKEEKQNIFYDYNCCLLTTWIRDLLFTISKNKCIESSDYYENKSEFKTILKINNPRCIIIRKYKNISIESQIKEFCKLGFKNIIVCQDDKTNNMYNIDNFRNYIKDKGETLIKLAKEENNYTHAIREPTIVHNDDIFYCSDLFLTNFLKWCCE
jgi:hypothetical protein